jgi:hypothetical protein
MPSFASSHVVRDQGPLMHRDNLRHLYDVVAAWNRITRELREHLAGTYQAEGYQQHHDDSQSVIGEAVL